MKPISEEFQQRLKQIPSTVCNCWILRRADDFVLGFTDHDQSIDVEGVVCEPESGLVAGMVEHSDGLSGDSSDVSGALTSGKLTEADIEAGLFDGAHLDHFLVDWERPDLKAKLGRSILGEVTTRDGAFTIEMRSAAAGLDRNLTRHFSRCCDAEFGDARCGIDAPLPAHSVTITVTGVSRERVTFTAGTALTIADFAFGKLVINTAGAQRAFRIQSLTLSTTGSAYVATVTGIGLTAELEGLTGHVIAGCDKTFATCRDRFSNAARFRGFPHIPSAEKALNYADGEGVFDGSPLVP